MVDETVKTWFFKKRTVFLLGLVVVFLSSVIGGETTGLDGDSSVFYDTVHTILAEYVTSSTSSEASNVSSYLATLYSSGDFSFYYVSLVVDKNDDALTRYQQLGDSIPAVYFDSGYTMVDGDPGSLDPYVESLNQCKSRIVHDLDIKLVALITDGDKIYVNITLINNECCGGAVYLGHLRVFVVEKTSQWTDETGKPFRYAMLDYVINSDVKVVYNNPKTLTAIWDTKGDVEPEDLMIIAAVYEEEQGQWFVTDTAAATPAHEIVDTVITSGPTGLISYRDVTFMWHASFFNGYLYSYTYRLTPIQPNWSTWGLDTFKKYVGLDEGSYTFMVKAKNQYGEVDTTPAERSFTVGLSPPHLQIVKPTKGLYVNSRLLFIFPVTVTIGFLNVEAEASDESGIDRVEFYVDDELKWTEQLSPYEYTVWRSSGSPGKHTIGVVAYDNVGLSSNDEITIWKLF